MNGESPLLLAEVFAWDYQSDQSATYVRVCNPGPHAADLTGCVLEWDAVPLAFPSGTLLAAGDSAYVAWNAGAFGHRMARLPEYTVQAYPDVPSMVPFGAEAPQAFNPTRGIVRLRANDGAELDMLVWGEATPPPGWNGATVRVEQSGQVFERSIDEGSLGPDSPGRFTLEPNAAAAWRQGTEWISRRIMRMGQRAETYPTWEVPSTEVFACPDSSFQTIARFIDAVQATLDINIYLFTQEALVPHLEAALKRNVAVRLLLEGEPVVGIPATERALLTRLQAAGAKVQCMIRAVGGFKRYHFNHAKYAIADGKWCLVMSDNWTHGSVPAAAPAGERGWGVIVDSPPMAEHLTSVFNFDWNPAVPDSVALNDAVLPEAGEAPPSGPVIPLANPVGAQRIATPATVTPVLAPVHALLETLALPGLMRSATRTLDLQQPTIPLYWTGAGPDSPETTPNLLLSEVLAAARRGVRVRIVLGGRYLNPQDPKDNTHTRDWLTTIAKAEQLPIEARILDYAATGMGVHNKGIIVDAQRVLISSINWTENSPLYNRELGLIVQSEAVAAYFGTLFGQDWDNGA